MKRPSAPRRPARPGDDVIDATYGLEPVFDPAATLGGAELGEFVVVECPYCAESFETAIDLTAGSQTTIEDCHVCCQPIELEIHVGDDGAIESFVVRRLD